MADIRLTIGDTTKEFNLTSQEGHKSWRITEEPIVPMKALVEIPSYGNLPPDRLQVFSVDNWIGGMGQTKHKEILDKYSSGSNIDTREPNKIILGPEITVMSLEDLLSIEDSVELSIEDSVEIEITTAILYPIIGFLFFNSREYAYSSKRVYRLNLVKTEWEVVFDAGSDTIECLASYNSYLYLGRTTGKYYYSSDGTSWILSTLDNAIFHFFNICPASDGSGDLLVGAMRPNTLRVSIDPTNTGSWTDPPYYISDNLADITGIFVVGGYQFIGKEDGLYYINDYGVPVPLLPELLTKRSSTNFKYATNFNACFYGSLLGDIGELTGGFVLSFIGPIILSGTGISGTICGLTSDDKNLYAVILIGGEYIIFAGRWRQAGDYGWRWEWCPLINLSTNACGALLVMQRTGENPRLWFAYGDSISYAVLTLSTSRPLSDSNYRFAPKGYLVTSWFDAGYDTWQKVWYQIWTATLGLVSNSSDTFIYIYYEADDSGVWALLATISSNGINLTNFNAISCAKIRLKIELITDDNELTPILTEFVLRGVLQPENTKIIDFTVALEQTVSRKVSTDLAFLRGGRNASSPITLKDLRFGTTRYVTFLPGSPAEVELVDEPSKQPTYAANIRAQELNWTPP